MITSVLAGTTGALLALSFCAFVINFRHPASLADVRAPEPVHTVVDPNTIHALRVELHGLKVKNEIQTRRSAEQFEAMQAHFASTRAYFATTQAYFEEEGWIVDAIAETMNPVHLDSISEAPLQNKESL